MWFTGTESLTILRSTITAHHFAKGEYILLLNNDTEIINDDCLEELLGYCTEK